MYKRYREDIRNLEIKKRCFTRRLFQVSNLLCVNNFQTTGYCPDNGALIRVVGTAVR